MDATQPTPAPESPAPRAGATATKETLELEKLRSEIELLKYQRRWHATPTFWFTVATTVIAVFGVIGQGYLSSIKSERAEFAVQKAQGRLEKIKADLAEAESRRLAASRAAAEAEATAKLYGQRIDSAKKTLDAIADMLPAIQRAGSSAGPELRDLLANLLVAVGMSRDALDPVTITVEGPDTTPNPRGPGQKHYIASFDSHPRGLEVHPFWGPILPGGSPPPHISPQYFTVGHPDAPVTPCRIPLAEGRYLIMLGHGHDMQYSTVIEVPTGYRSAVWPATQPSTQTNTISPASRATTRPVR